MMCQEVPEGFYKDYLTFRNSLSKQVFLFYRWRNWGSERLGYLSEIAEEVAEPEGDAGLSDGIDITPQSGLRAGRANAGEQSGGRATGYHRMQFRVWALEIVARLLVRLVWSGLQLTKILLAGRCFSRSLDTKPKAGPLALLLLMASPFGKDGDRGRSHTGS